jgi:hypothetical protein
VEKKLAEGRGNAALVSAVFDPFDDAVKEPPGVKMRLQFTLVISGPTQNP